MTLHNINYLYSGLYNKTLYFSYVNCGSYSIGFNMEFLKDCPQHLPDKVFIKLIPLIDENMDKEYEDFIRINYKKRICMTSTESFNEEIRIQKYAYNNKSYNSPACPQIYDSFIVDDNDKKSIKVFDLFRSLKSLEITDVLDIKNIHESMEILPDIKLGLMIMPYIEGENGYKFYRNFTTPTLKFGHFFDAKLIKNEILSGKVKTQELFCVVQVMYRFFELYGLGILHDDLHLGNFIFNKTEVCTTQAILSDEKINPNFTGRVYIIDYGNVVAFKDFKKLIDKYIKIKTKKTPGFIYDASNFSQFLEILARKIIYDGYNHETKAITDEWYLYDWVYNIFFDSNMRLNNEISNIFQNYMVDFGSGLRAFNDRNNKKNSIASETTCCYFFDSVFKDNL